MNPLRLRAENYRSFAELDLDLPDGCVAVVGENGAGKSSLVELIDLALFAGRGELGQWLTRGGLSTEMLIELEFEHAGDLYRVRRGYSARGAGKATLDFERLAESRTENGHGLTASEAIARWYEPLTRETVQATQALIEETLGLSRQTFRASAFLAQGDGAAFTEAQPRERKAILAEVLGLDVWDRLLERVRLDLRADEQRLAVLAADTERAEADLALRPTLAADREHKVHAAEATRVAIATLDEDLEQARVRFQEMREQRAKVETARAEAKAASETLTRLQMIAAAGARAKAELPAVEAQLTGLPDAEMLVGLERREQTLRERCEAHDRQVAAWEAGKREYALAAAQQSALYGQAEELRTEADDLDRKAETLEHEHRPDVLCELCGQTLGEEARQTAIAAWRVRASDLREGAADRGAQAEALTLPDIPAPPEGERPDSALHAASVALREAREQAVQAGALRERIGTLQQTIEQAEDDGFLVERDFAEDTAARTAADLEALEEAAPAQGDVDTVRAKGDALRYQLEQARETLAGCERDLAKVDAELERLDGLEAQIAEGRQERERLHAELDVLAKLERAFSRDGIPALIVENAAIPQIESEATRILTEFGLPLRVELRTQKALKSGDGIREALDIVVVTPEGERPYETFSGGERTRLNLALRIGLAGLLASRRGAESRLLVIDEPDGLDADGMERLVAILDGLEGTFDRRIVISHQDDLKAAFPSVLHLVGGGKSGEPSRILPFAPEPVEAVA